MKTKWKVIIGFAMVLLISMSINQCKRSTKWKYINYELDRLDQRLEQKMSTEKKSFNGLAPDSVVFTTEGDSLY
jgi:hypothetical protein